MYSLITFPVSPHGRLFIGPLERFGRLRGREGGGRGKVVRGGLREEDFILRSLLMATAPIITSLIALGEETTRGWSVERIVVPMSSLPASCGGHHHPNPSSTTSQTTVSKVLLAAKMGTQEKNWRIYWRLCVPLLQKVSLSLDTPSCSPSPLL